MGMIKNGLPTARTALQQVCNSMELKFVVAGGDDSWGARPHDQYRLTVKEFSYSFRMKALAPGYNATELAKVKL